MRATFVPIPEEADVLEAIALDLPDFTFIKALVIDESGSGVEIRVMSDGQVLSFPLEKGVEHYRKSPLWVELVT